MIKSFFTVPKKKRIINKSNSKETVNINNVQIEIDLYLSDSAVQVLRPHVIASTPPSTFNLSRSNQVETEHLCGCAVLMMSF